MDTFSSLKTTIADYLARNDMTDQIPSFIKLAEARMSRELQNAMLEEVAQADIVADQRFITLPADLRSIREVATIDGTTRTGLRYLAPAQLDEDKKQNPTRTDLSYFSITSQDLELWACPSKDMKIEIVYNEGVQALSDSQPTTTMLTRHPDAYLYGALAHAYDYLQDETRAQSYDAKFTRALAEVMRDTEKQRFGTADLQIRSVSSGF